MPLEKDIENLILEYLSYLPDGFFWKNNSTGIYDAVKGTFRNNKNPWIINGVADILGVYKGKFVAIEVKRPGGITSDDQQIFIDRIIKEGGLAGVATNLYEVNDILGVKNARGKGVSR